MTGRQARAMLSGGRDAPETAARFVRSPRGDLLRADSCRTPVACPATVDFAGSRTVPCVRDIQRSSRRTRIRISCLSRHLHRAAHSQRRFNRNLEPDIEAALSMGRPLAVLCLGLDSIQGVNDLLDTPPRRELQVVPQLDVGSSMTARRSRD